ncbi:MAG: hypothetical protein J6X43_10135, partial [Bacteroidales bacterium]|nr:hypothetical protein [Bacteroidales bacterium]
MGSGKTKIYIGNLQTQTRLNTTTGKTEKYKTIQVEETSQTSGLFIPKSANNNSWSNGEDNLNNGNFNNLFGTGFEVKETITITEFNATVMSSIYNTNDGQNSGTANIGFTIYSAGIKDGKYVINTNNRKGTLSATYNRTRTSSQVQDYTDEITATGNVVLTPGIYYITPTSYSSTGSLQNFKIKRGRTPNNPTNLKDNAGGNILQFVSIASKDNPDQNNACFGYVYNIGFKTGQGFCDRINVDIIEDCDCDAPSDFWIIDKLADEQAEDTVYICENRPQGTLGTSAWWATDDVYSYEWTKDGQSVFGGASEGKVSRDITISEEGWHKVLVYHTKNPTVGKCQRSDSVYVKMNPIPNVTISGGGSWCYGDDASATPITFTMTGEPRFKVGYQYTTPSNSTPKSDTKRADRGQYTTSLDVPTEVGTYTYSLKSVNDGGECSNKNVSGIATIVIKPIPTVSITPTPADATVCEGGSVSLSATSDPTGADFAWKKDGTNNATGADITLTDPTQSGEYSVVATLDLCPSEPATQQVTIHPSPVIT